MFQKGDKVVYPHHGAGIIEAIKEKRVFSEKKKYYVLKFTEGQLMISVPIDNCDELGLRSIINKRQASKVLKVLSDKSKEESIDCTERFKINSEKLSTGNIHSAAEVLRDLSTGESISTREKRLLSKAKKIMISELVYIYKKTEEEMDKKIVKMLN